MMVSHEKMCIQGYDLPNINALLSDTVWDA